MTTTRQLSFSGGEIAPALYARVDTTKYQYGLRQCRNWYIMRHGGATNRPGSEFIGEVKDSSKTVRLIPFFFNTDQTYMLEFGDEYLRVIRNGAYVSDLTLTITGITNANPAVLTYTGTDPANGDEFYISAVGGMTEVNGRNFKVVNVNTGANTFELDYLDGTNVNSLTWGTYTSGGTADRIYTVVSPYDYLDLPDLQFVQSADVITLAHPSYAPRTLSRSGHTSWTFATITFAPSQAAPTNVTNNGAVGSTYQWVVTAFNAETGEESLQSSATSSSAATPTINWTAASGATAYNVYQLGNGVYGYIGTAVGTAFAVAGDDPDFTENPPAARNPFSGTGNYPSCVNYIQQRLTFANTNNNPEGVWMSQTGRFYNFTIHQPIVDTDSITFKVAGRQVNEVRHLIDLSNLVVLTESGEWVVTGGLDDVLKASEINPKQFGYSGSSTLSPIIVGNIGLFVQARGTVVRDLVYTLQDEAYNGQELSIYGAHLFDNHTIDDWALQKIPHSIVWCVRDDGVLLGLTYVREQQIIAWHRHDFSGGTVENVAVIPEGNEDAVYLVVRRTINGATVRYVEKLATRTLDEIEDAKFVDCFLSYDGRNGGATTMTLSGGTTWEYDEDLTLTASASTFLSTDVGNEVHITGTDGTVLRCEIKTYTNATVVVVRSHMTVPVAMRSTAFTDWSMAVDELTGLWHLEGETVSVFADATVVASANNAAYVAITVEDGAITLDRPYAVIHVGLPITADLETLNIDSTGIDPLADKRMIISSVSMTTESTRGLFVGTRPPTDDDTNPLEGLYEMKIRQFENYGDPVSLATDTVNVKTEGVWNNNGRVFIRQVDPVPATVLAVLPAGMIPIRRAGS